MTKHTVSDSDALRAATSFSLLDRSTARLRPWPALSSAEADDPAGRCTRVPRNRSRRPGSPVPEAPTAETVADLLSHAGASLGGLRPAGGPARPPPTRTRPAKGGGPLRTPRPPSCHPRGPGAGRGLL